MDKKRQPEDMSSDYVFAGGYPTPETVQRAYDDLDMIRAMQVYRMFYPTVSCAAIFEGSAQVGLRPNAVFGYMDTQPKHVGYTLNSDTPYGAMPLDLRAGPLVVELQPGPLIGAVLDVNQRWIADMGVPGPDAGNGGKHLLLPPGYEGPVPPGYHVARATSWRVMAAVRALPVGGDVPGAVARMLTTRVYPLEARADWTEPAWIDMTPGAQDTTPHAWEDTFRFWEALNDTVQAEPPLAGWREHYGELAALGIVKGAAFQPDARMRHILERAAAGACAQMRVESFADRRPDRVVWPDRQWEWPALRFENGFFETANYNDTYARDKWFFQAIAESPAMFRRSAGAGSLYWLGLRDSTGAYLDGSHTYRLAVPLPVPEKLFWSVTVYDAETRSQIATGQGKAALRSLFELKEEGAGAAIDLYFGPSAPPGQEAHWIQTIPGQGWFVYFRIYGPDQAAFDGVWKPGDFERIGEGAAAGADVALDEQQVSDAYIYLLARLLVLRQQQLDFQEGFQWNQLVHRKPGEVNWPNPNLDVAYSEAWVAIDEGSCLLVSVPEVRDRYYTVQFLNGWGETVANINERTFPQHPAGEFAVCLAGSQVDLAPGVQRVDVPVKAMRVLSRVQLGDDWAGAVALQQRFAIRASGTPALPPIPATPLFDMKALPGVEALEAAVPALDSEADINPGMEDLQAACRAIAAAIADPAVRQRVDDMVRRRAFADIHEAMPHLGHGIVRNGWALPSTSGVYGDDWLVRTLIDYGGIWANTPEEVIYYKAFFDPDGKPLSGDRSFTMHFSAEETPERFASFFWSVIAVDAVDRRVLPNPAQRYLLNPETRPEYGADGSLTLYFGADQPPGAPPGNWLPTPRGIAYSLTFRFYRPQGAVAERRYFPPPLKAGR